MSKTLLREELNKGRRKIAVAESWVSVLLLVTRMDVEKKANIRKDVTGRYVAVL